MQLLQSQLALEESRARFRDLYDHARWFLLRGLRARGADSDANRTLADMLGHDVTYLNSHTLLLVH